MLKNTFLHIPGIGTKTERRLWESGIHHWRDIAEDCPVRLARPRLNSITRCLEESRHHLETNNPNYFSDLLPSSLHWRFFPEFRNSTVYLDIETTGLDSWENEITTIALYDGNCIAYYINGRNLHDFTHDIKKHKVIVTYNGKCFDVPFIERYFGIEMNHAHIDLRYILSGLGCKGGLKSCEIQLGIDRGPLTGIDGFFAVLLWYDYQRNGNEKALETLLAYNIQDVLTLEKLMVIAYNIRIKDTPFYGSPLALPILPGIPFNVDMETVRRIDFDMRTNLL